MSLETRDMKEGITNEGTHNDIWFSSPASAWFPVTLGLNSKLLFLHCNSIKTWRAVTEVAQNQLLNIPRVVKYSSKGIWILPKPKVSWESQYQKARLTGS